MKNTGTFVTKEELKGLKEDWQKALDTPVMILKGGQRDMASYARGLVTEKVQELAKKHGLQTIEDNYGVDFESGEFLEF